MCRRQSVRFRLARSTPPDIRDDELHEVGVAVRDLDFFDRAHRRFAWPGRLTCGAVAVEAGSGSGNPVVEAVACVGEVAMPAEGGGAVLLGVVGTEPVKVQGGEFPHEFGVPVPERRDHRGGQTIRAAEPVDPAVQLDPFGLGLLRGEHVPVDRMRRLGDQLLGGVVEGLVVKECLVEGASAEQGFRVGGRGSSRCVDQNRVKNVYEQARETDLSPLPEIVVPEGEFRDSELVLRDASFWMTVGSVGLWVLGTAALLTGVGAAAAPALYGGAVALGAAATAVDCTSGTDMTGCAVGIAATAAGPLRGPAAAVGRALVGTRYAGGVARDGIKSLEWSATAYGIGTTAGTGAEMVQEWMHKQQ